MRDLSAELAQIMDCDLDSLTQEQADVKIEQIKALQQESLRRMIGLYSDIDSLGDFMDDALGLPRVDPDKKIPALLATLAPII